MKSKIKQSPKLPPEERREQLLKAARKLFVKKGYRGSTTDKIARAAGLTKGALYYHFKKKEDILFALVEQMCAQHELAVEKQADIRVTPVEVVEALMKIHQGEKMAEFHQVVDIWAQAMRIPRIRRFLAGQYAQMVDDVEDCLDRRFGRRRQDRRRMAVFTLALQEGLAVHKMMNPDQVDVPSQVRLLQQLLAAAVKPSKPGKKNRATK